MSGRAAIAAPASTHIRDMLENLHKLYQGHGWHLRFSTNSWVQWAPRERNQIADRLANYALDKGMAYVYTLPQPSVGLHNANYLVMSDGAFRASSGDASGAWAIFRMLDDGALLVAAGASPLRNCPDSMMAEIEALRMGIDSYIKLASDLELERRNATTINLLMLPIQDFIDSTGKRKRTGEV